MERPRPGIVGTEFWCNICKVGCASPVNLQTHFLGTKHKLLEKALKAHGIVNSGSPDPGKAADAGINEQVVGLGDQLDGCRSTEPAIGLEHLLEYRSQSNSLWYECQLCDCEAGLTNMFMHVVGAKHRQAYLERHYPDMMEEVAGSRGSEANKKLKQLAAEVERRYGRKKIQVVTDTRELKRKFEFDEEEEAARPNKNQGIDFTSDECFLDTPPPPPPPKSVLPQTVPSSFSFQELKRAQAEAIKRQGLDKSVDGFGSKKEFVDYLRQFQIHCEDDAAFILTITQNFTRSLVKYREKVKEKAEASAAAPPVAYPPQQQGYAPHPTGQNVYTEYPPKDLPGQQAPAPFGHNVYTEYPPKNNPGQQALLSEPPSAPVSGPPSSGYNADPPPFTSPTKPVGPAPANTTALPGGLGPLQETNKATIEFFTSIKNMDAEEVSATLNKIAATNPAFRGIDIPNVIKILQESGSLKPSNKASGQY